MTTVDKILWKRRAMAFVIRSHRHLWGKNNEDPLSFLYLQGLSNDFSKSLYLGWNKFSQERPCTNWGIPGEGTFLIPSGIVFPYIVDKDLRSVFIIPMDLPSATVMLPGSDPQPVILGPLDTADVPDNQDLLQGLVQFQNNPDGCVRITLPCPGIRLRPGKT